MTLRNGLLAIAKSLVAQEKPLLVRDAVKWAACKCQELSGAGHNAFRAPHASSCTRVRYLHFR